LISVGVVTSSRADFGYYRPLLDRLQNEPGVDHRLIVTGAHLAADYGFTVQEIEEAGYEIGARVESFSGDDTPSGIAGNMSKGLLGFAELFSSWQPDLLMVFGDRHDMIPAALAALPFGIPVAHIYGGEVTEGAIDDALRHSMTKLSHLHFVSTDLYSDRVLQMGEAADRVVVAGSLGIDALAATELMSPAELEQAVGFDTTEPFALVTFHPVTLESAQTETYIRNLLRSVEVLSSDRGINAVFTAPNPDTSSDVVLSNMRRYCSENNSAHLVMNAGSRAYFSLMSTAELMIGNSSSGIIEAPSFKLPVVNVGTRQAGRIRAANVIDCGYEVDEILAAVDRAVSAEFRSGLTEMKSPFGDGRAVERIVERILAIDDSQSLLRKRFST
jgi:UDP-hydrolysing UDP-N-acetyl-D-glucosamine 2-epimerase